MVMAQGTDVESRSGHGHNQAEYQATHTGPQVASASGKGTIPKLDIPPRHTGIAGFLGFHPGLIVLLVLACFVPPVFSSYWVFNITVGYVLAIACMGLLVVVGWGREISLAQAGLTGSALYISGYFYRTGTYGKGFSYPAAVGVGIAFAVIVSCLVALVSMRLAGVYVIVLTLSLQFLLENSVMLSEKMTGGLSAPTTPRPNFFGASLRSDKQFYYYVLGIMLVTMLFLTKFRNSRFGRSLLMVGSDKAAAAAVGVSPWMYKVAAFGIAGLLAGVAGGLSAPLYFSPPGTLQYISFNSLFYLSIPILAGFESLTAIAIVAVTFTLIPQILLSWKINVYLLGGIGLTVGILVGPRGVGGTVMDMFDPAARAKKKNARGGAGAAPKMPNIPGLKPKTAAQLGGKRGKDKE
jgi:branched-chain amino acid transport system permease protein